VLIEESRRLMIGEESAGTGLTMPSGFVVVRMAAGMASRHQNLDNCSFGARCSPWNIQNIPCSVVDEATWKSICK